MPDNEWLQLLAKKKKGGVTLEEPLDWLVPIKELRDLPPPQRRQAYWQAAPPKTAGERILEFLGFEYLTKPPEWSAPQIPGYQYVSPEAERQAGSQERQTALFTELVGLGILSPAMLAVPSAIAVRAVLPRAASVVAKQVAKQAAKGGLERIPQVAAGTAKTIASEVAARGLLPFELLEKAPGKAVELATKGVRGAVRNIFLEAETAPERGALGKAPKPKKVTPVTPEVTGIFKTPLQKAATDGERIYINPEAKFKSIREIDKFLDEYKGTIKNKDYERARQIILNTEQGAIEHERGHLFSTTITRTPFGVDLYSVINKLNLEQEILLRRGKTLGRPPLLAGFLKRGETLNISAEEIPGQYALYKLFPEVQRKHFPEIYSLFEKNKSTIGQYNLPVAAIPKAKVPPVTPEVTGLTQLKTLADSTIKRNELKLGAYDLALVDVQDLAVSLNMETNTDAFAKTIIDMVNSGRAGVTSARDLSGAININFEAGRLWRATDRAGAGRQVKFLSYKPPIPPVVAGVPPTVPPEAPLAPVLGERQVLPLRTVKETQDLFADKSKLKTFARENRFFRWVVSTWDKSLLMDDPTKAEAVISGTFQHDAKNKTLWAFARVREAAQTGSNYKIKGNIVTDKRIKPLPTASAIAEKGGLDVMHEHQIAEYLPHYDMPPEMRGYFESIRSVAKEVEGILIPEIEKYGVKVRRLQGETGFQYIRRIVSSIEGLGDLVSTRYKNTQLPRTAALQGVTAGKEPVKYLRLNDELEGMLRGAYNAIARFRTKEFIVQELTEAPMTRVAPEIIEDLVTLAPKYKAARRIMGESTAKVTATLEKATGITKVTTYTKTQGIFPRIGRGEDIAPATRGFIERQFPELLEKIKRIEAMPKGTTRKAAATRLGKEFAETYDQLKFLFNEAERAYKLAKEGALRAAGKATGGMVAPGRIFPNIIVGGRTITGQKVAMDINKQFAYYIEPSFLQKAGVVISEVLIQTKAAVDLSVSLMQTLAVAGMDFFKLTTGQAGKAAWGEPTLRGWASLFSPRSALAHINKSENRALIEEFIQHGGDFSISEFTGATHILGAIPIVGKVYTRTGAAFEFGRSLTALNLYKAERARALMGAVGEEQINLRLRELAKFINLATGRMPTEMMGISTNQRAVERIMFFAPQYNRSVFSLILGMAKGGYTGRVAREAVIGLVGGAYAFHTALALAMGQKPRLNPLPESMGGDGAKWLSVKVGNAYLGVGSTTFALLRLFGSNWETLNNHPEDLFRVSMDNPNVRFIRSKFGAVSSIGADLITGHDYLGQLTRDNAEQTITTLLKWSVPIWVEDVMEQAFVRNAPVDWQLATMGMGEIIGGRGIPETDQDKLRLSKELYAQQYYNLPWKSLRTYEKTNLYRKYPDLETLQTKVDKFWATTGTDFQRWWIEYRQRAVDTRNAQWNDAAQLLLLAKITKKDYDSERSYLRTYMSGEMAALEQARKELDPDQVMKTERYVQKNQHPDDAAYDQYAEFRHTAAENAITKEDWEAFELKSAEFLARFPFAQQEYIKARLNDYANSLPPEAKKIELMRQQGIVDDTWWDNYNTLVSLAPRMPVMPPPIPTQRDLKTESISKEVLRGFK